MRRYLTPSLVAVTLAALSLVVFGSISHAANAAVGEQGTWLDLARPLYDAFVGGHYAFAAAGLVVVLVAAARRYGGQVYPWFHTDAGGAALALVGAAASALVAGLAAPGAAVNLTLLWSALGVGVAAAGGFAIVKHLLVEPWLRPLHDRCPAWLRPVFRTVLWIFDGRDPDAAPAVTPPPTEVK